ncbi:DUF2274 domain-containing protein [Rhizorhabdus argentea]|uniref:DUF2274 domain-containing protein n=1 Tax=Rhizorhabdus argentea TaxID=1387174 RepID=UPI0030EDC98E
MAQLKLPKQSDQKPIDVTIRLTGDLRRALDRYAALYRASYDEEISVPDLIPAILSEFLASDAEFETGTAGGPARSRAKVEEPPEPIKPLTDTPERMIQLREVMQLIGLGKTMIYRMIQENRFPPPYKLSPGASRWSEAEVLAWIENLKVPTSSRHRWR